MTRRRMLALVAVAVLGLAALVWFTGGRFPWAGSTARCDLPERIAPNPAPATAAPGGGGIEVVEQGFTQDANRALSIGAVVRNTSASVAYRTRLTFRLFGAGHTELTASGAEELSVEIPVLLPGQRIGAGQAGFTRPVTSVDTVPGTATWLPREAIGPSFTPVTGGYLRTLRFNPRIPASVDIHYRENSGNCRALDRRETAVVFRDSGGRIVGGGTGAPGLPIVFRDERGRDLGGEGQRSAEATCAPGNRETWVVPLGGGPAAAEDGRTEVYPYCDPSAG